MNLPPHFVAFCEARADFELVRDLIDRVLREEGPPWIGDLLDADADAVRRYVRSEGSEFFDIHRQRKHALELGVRIPHGHFDGKPGAAGAAMARTSFAIGRQLRADAVVVMWDLDQQAAERRVGLHQAVADARLIGRFVVVVGAPNIMREAWVLAGFVAKNASEHQLLRELRQELGFSPTERAHQLDSNDAQARRSAKRVLAKLSSGDLERERECWCVTPLETLRERSADTGLVEFLDDARQLLDLLTRS